MVHRRRRNNDSFFILILSTAISAYTTYSLTFLLQRFPQSQLQSHSILRQLPVIVRSVVLPLFLLYALQAQFPSHQFPVFKFFKFFLPCLAVSHSFHTSTTILSVHSPHSATFNLCVPALLIYSSPRIQYQLPQPYHSARNLSVSNKSDLQLH